MLRTSAVVALLFSASLAATPLGTQITYQGQLREGGSPANGTYDFEICLFDAQAPAGIQVACHPVLEDQAVAAGLFALALDFGATAFAGEERFLEVRVRTGASTGAFTPLLPRQRVTSAPYALHAAAVRNDAIGSLQLADASVSSGDLATGAVGTIHVLDAAITAAKLAPNSVDGTRLAPNSVASSHIVDATILAADIAPGAIGLAQVDVAQLQARISGTCPPGEFFRGFGDDGTPACDPVPGLPRVTIVFDGPSGAATQSSMVIPPDGRPLIAFRTISGNGDLVFVRCGNAACSRGNVQRTPFPDGSDTGFLTQIALAGDGLPVMAHVDDTTKAVRFVHCDSLDCATATTTVIEDAFPNQVGAGLSMAIGADGFPIFSYGDRTDLSLRFARCGSHACSAGTVTSVELLDPVEDIGIETAMVVGSDGLPFIAYRDSTSAEIDVVHCGNADCSSGNVFTSGVDTAPAAELGLDVALGDRGRPLLAYRVNGQPGFSTFQCSDVACTGGAEGVYVDPEAHSFGGRLSLAVDPGGLPIVAGNDTTTGGLRVVRCEDALCDNAAVATTVDDAFSVVGVDPSLALGADGLPIVSYQHATNGALRVAKCGTLSCR